MILFSGKTTLADKQPAERSYDPSCPIPAVKHEAYTFKNEDLETVMYKVGKWYNTGFAYIPPIRERFTGTIPENASLDEALQILEGVSTIRLGRYGYTVIISK
jgi:type II secretory pathway component GspD/PulD (secretin)